MQLKLLQVDGDYDFHCIHYGSCSLEYDAVTLLPLINPRLVLLPVMLVFYFQGGGVSNANEHPKL